MENKKELEQLAKFAVNLTHEFTTPMRTLVSTLEELQRSETDDSKKMQLDVALRNAYRFVKEGGCDAVKLEVGKGIAFRN